MERCGFPLNGNRGTKKYLFDSFDLEISYEIEKSHRYYEGDSEKNLTDISQNLRKYFLVSHFNSEETTGSVVKTPTRHRGFADGCCEKVWSVQIHTSS